MEVNRKDLAHSGWRQATESGLPAMTDGSVRTARRTAPRKENSGRVNVAFFILLLNSLIRLINYSVRLSLTFLQTYFVCL